MKPVLLAVAPVPKRSAGLPFDYAPEHIAAEVIACAESGAVMAHLHVLDAAGTETTDPAAFDETLRLIRRGSEILLQGSTGGSPEQPLGERAVSLDHALVQTASLNMGSVNFGDEVYRNPLPDVRAFAARMAGRKIRAEMEIFDLSMLYVGMDFVRRGLAPPHFNLCFGFENAMPAREEVLRFLLEQLANVPGAVVGVLHTHAKDFHFLELALNLGVDILRVGFEDATMGATGNAELVRGLRARAQAAGRPIAGIAQAKSILGVKE